MAQDRSRLHQDPRYAAFLYNAVGEDARGASVTVLSMLARLGVDPWQEAHELAGMPAASARQRLGVLMQRFVDVPSMVPARLEVVSRLLAVLPRETGEQGPTGNGSAAITPATRAAVFWILALVVLFALFRSLGHVN